MDEDTLQQLITALLDSFVSAPQDIFHIGSYNSNKSGAWNYTDSREAQRYQFLFNNSKSTTATNLNNDIQQKIYAVLGFSPEASRKDIENKFIGSFIEKQVIGRITAPVIAGLDNLYNAAFSRRNDYLVEGDEITDNNDKLLSDKAYAKSFTDLGNRILKNHLERSDYGSLSFTEVGSLAGLLIANGRYSGDIKTQERKLTTLESDLKAYAKDIEKLRDVIDGPVDEIINTLDTLTGKNILNLSTASLGSFAQSLRETMTTSGLSLADFGRLSADVYGYGSNYGETQAMAVQNAMSAARILSAGNSSADISDRDYANALAHYSADFMSSYTGATVYAGLLAFADKEGLDPYSEETQTAYIKALKANAGSNSAFSAENIMSVTGTTRKDLADLSITRDTRDLQESTSFIEYVLTESAKATSGDIIEYTESTVKNRLKDSGLDDDEIDSIAQQLGAVALDDHRAMSQAITELKFSDEVSDEVKGEVRKRLRPVVRVIENLKGDKFGMSNPVAENIYKNQDKISNSLSKKTFFEDKTIRQTAGGWEGILQSVYRGNTNINDLIQAGYGFNPVRSLIELGKLDQPTDQKIADALGVSLNASKDTISKLGVLDKFILTDNYNNDGSVEFKQAVLNKINAENGTDLTLENYSDTISGVDAFTKGAEKYRLELKKRWFNATEAERDSDEFKEIKEQLLASSSLHIAPEIEMATRLNLSVDQIDSMLHDNTEERDMVDTAKRVRHAYKNSNEALSDADLRRYVTIESAIYNADNGAADLLSDWFEDENAIKMSPELRDKLKKANLDASAIDFLESSKSTLKESGASIFERMEPMEDILAGLLNVLGNLLGVLQDIGKNALVLKE